MSEATSTENQVVPEVSNEKLFSDFEKQNFANVFQKQPSIRAKRLSLFASSFLAFVVLLFAAYFSSKVINNKVDNVDYGVLEQLAIVEPYQSNQVVYDVNKAVFPIDDDYASQAVIVFDLTANRPIYTKNADTKTLIASLTKLASSTVLINTVDLKKETEISEEIEEINGSSLHFKKGEKYTNLDLIKAAVIVSSNQGSFAANDPEDTVDKMNELAQALHLENTNFANPAGFDDEGNYSTATEYIQIAKLFFQNDQLKEFASLPKAEVKELGENKSVKISNTNDLIRLGTKYVVAGKTGTTPKAGQNLLLLIEKNGRQYITILLNGADRYKDAYKVIDRLP